MGNDDNARMISADTARARAAALGLRFSAADDGGAARELVERLAAAAEDAERMGELGLAGYEPAVEFRPISERE